MPREMKVIRYCTGTYTSRHLLSTSHSQQSNADNVARRAGAHVSLQNETCTCSIGHSRSAKRMIGTEALRSNEFCRCHQRKNVLACEYWLLMVCLIAMLFMAEYFSQYN